MRGLLARVRRLQRRGPEAVGVRLVEQLVVVRPGDPGPPLAWECPAEVAGRRLRVVELIVVGPDGGPVSKGDG